MRLSFKISQTRSHDTTCASILFLCLQQTTHLPYYVCTDPLFPLHTEYYYILTVVQLFNTSTTSRYPIPWAIARAVSPFCEAILNITKNLILWLHTLFLISGLAPPFSSSCTISSLEFAIMRGVQPSYIGVLTCLAMDKHKSTATSLECTSSWVFGSTPCSRRNITICTFPLKQLNSIAVQPIYSEMISNSSRGVTIIIAPHLWCRYQHDASGEIQHISYDLCSKQTLEQWSLWPAITNAHLNKNKTSSNEHTSLSLTSTSGCLTSASRMSTLPW